MKRNLVMLLVAAVMFTFVSCSNSANDSGASEGTVIEDISNESSNLEDEITLEDIQAEEGGLELENDQEESLFKEKYNMVEQMLENRKMSILKAEDNEIEAENGIGEKLIYSLDVDKEISVTYIVNLTTILNEGMYDIQGTVLSNVLNILGIDENYISNINEAISTYFAENMEEYKSKFDEIEVNINKEYEFIKITIFI